MSLYVAQLIHHARNRLVVVADRLAAQGNDTDVGEIHRAAEQLAGAMAVLRLEQAAPLLATQEVDLQDFFCELTTEARGLCPPHLKMICRADFSACLFNFWTFDRQLVRLAVLDALMNAWRHAAGTVELAATWQDGELTFTVRDDGPGFSPAYLSANADASIPPPVGTGNGLRLARKIAEQHTTGGRHGRVSLTNDGGAVFCLALP